MRNIVSDLRLSGRLKLKKKSRARGWTRERWPLVIGIVFFLAVLAVCALYHRTAITPLPIHEIGPGSDPTRWTFSLEDGTAVWPEDGILPVDGPNAVVICETEVTGDVRELPLIVVTSKSSDCVFFLEGQLLYAPSGRYRNGGFSEDAFTTASGQFGLPALGNGKRLTMIVQFQDEENRLSRMPKLTLYPSAVYYYSQHTSSAAGEALPAGIYFTVALFLMSLFLLGLWKKQSDYALILLAFCSLAMAFQRTASYGYGVMELFQSPAVTWFCTVLPQAAISWMLWYRLSKKWKLLMLPILGTVTAAILALFGLGLNNLNWVNPMRVMSEWLVPATVLLLLAAAAFDAVKGNMLLRRFFRYLAWSIPVVAFVWVFSLLVKGNLAQALKTAFSSLIGPTHTLFYLCGQLSTLLLLLGFVQAVLELIADMARQDAEVQTLTVRERYAAENLEIMRQAQEETRRQRHEMRHHLTLLEEMLSQRQDSRASDYIRSLLSEVEALPSGTYSDNMVINAIAGHYLNLAKAEGVRVDANIKAEKELSLRDEELCVLLTNLLENALEACRAMRYEQDRLLSLRIVSKGDHILIACENSTDMPVTIAQDGTISTSKSDADNHGYGISAMRRIVEKHCGALKLSCADGRFQIVITI